MGDTSIEQVGRTVLFSSGSALVIALTREMGPDTLLRAEALGVAASMRAPATPQRLQVVLEPLLGRDGASRARDPD